MSVAASTDTRRVHVKRILGMAISATEIDGKLDVGIAVQDAAEGLAACVGTHRILLDTEEATCCLRCWMAEVVELLAEALPDADWKITHGADCEGGEDVVGHS